jgi:transcriptional regulator with XRE-family HTH domain
MRTGFVSERFEVGAGASKSPHSDITRTGLELVQPKCVAEQFLGQPDTRHAEIGAIRVAAADEVGNSHRPRTRGMCPPLSRPTSLSGDAAPSFTIATMVKIDTSRLRDLIRERNLTARAVSRALGTNDTLVRDILSGKSRNPQALTLARIADHLGVPLSEFVSGTEHVDSDVGGRIEITELPMLGPVQAGAWLAIDDTGQEEPPMMPAAPDRRYPHARQWLREVQGDSMNARNIFPGDLAHIVELVGSGVNLNTGMIVEVTRERDGGGLREITLKEVEIADDGSLILWPRSSNQKWKDPIRLSDDTGSDIQVEITGLLLAKITRF